MDPVDKDEIMLPQKVQELITRSIRTFSNSMSNRSPDMHLNHRSASRSLNPVQEELEELE